MPKRPPVARTLPALHRAIDQLRARKAKVAIVPTMGALHDGHLTLVRNAKRRGLKVVVSIFVNPTQFAPHEDFASYPRTMNTDLDKLATLAADLVWAPTAAVMYPEDYASRIAVDGPAVAGLEDKYRPHFFSGVATVVGKLFNQCRPDFAIFGEKDYQQLKVVTRMSRDLDMRVKVIGVPTVREKDGLAMSSRNVYLSADERRTAPILHRTMKEISAQLRAGAEVETALVQGRTAITEAGFAIDYLEARHAEALMPISSMKDGPVRLLVAAKIGRTRLIDNMRA
ncbi:pantoate--beta-alanine ligase [Bradyrhizobium sp. LHD-71]|uniref:pantoate--beta-alanine ligase n=1 Tax=Bradyrhizobium sp. LHD-71 TaxID=3072141 RepID=UPI00280C992D|nr:pantoate--beta-alanine ligase [Bradyrhizobium sp. LHD-71]MDQ8726320.1 pantoate--beta-alanine ligase [Bradyrhizobium sp. LHD-71]